MGDAMPAFQVGKPRQNPRNRRSIRCTLLKGYSPLPKAPLPGSTPVNYLADDNVHQSFEMRYGSTAITGMVLAPLRGFRSFRPFRAICIEQRAAELNAEIDKGNGGNGGWARCPSPSIVAPSPVISSEARDMCVRVSPVGADPSLRSG